MSMAMALEGTRDYLRNANSWDHTLCGIQFEARPPNRAGQFYVALDDGGVSTGPDNTDALTEIYTIEVAVWRRPGHLPRDREGELQKVDDIYLSNIQTLHSLEREIIARLHNNYSLMTAVNAQFSLPTGSMADKFLQPWVYRGRSKVEGMTDDNGNRTFIGRRLQFRGMKRIQKRGSIG